MTRSFRDDLLDDLRQAPVRPAAAPAAAPVEQALEPAPAVELRITPRTWSAAGWTRRPEGVTISLGPVCLSLGNLGP